MKRNSSASVWLLLSLVAALFCLSVAAPREWSSWDSNPVGPARQASTLTLMIKPPQGLPLPAPSPPVTLVGLAGSDSILTTAVEPPVEQPEQDLPKPIPQPLPTSTDRRVADSDPDRARGTIDPVELPPTGFSPPAAEAATGAAAQRIRLATSSRIPTATLPQLGITRQALGADPAWLPCWPCATALLAQLDELSNQPSCRDWCSAVRQRLDDLHAADSLTAPQVPALLSGLRVLLEDGQRLARETSDDQVRSRWSRVVFALQRRVQVWDQVAVIAARESLAEANCRDADTLRQAYAALSDQLQSLPKGDVWGRYLLMDEARSRLFGELAADTVESRNLAKRILMRADTSVLTPSQQAFLQRPECAEYLRQLRRVATEPVDYARLLAELESYESDRPAAAALHVAAAQQVLRWSDDEAIRELGQRLDTIYRNANLRVAISRSLMERLLPPPEPVAERVDEVIQGAYTTGCCETLTQLEVCLLPSETSWRIGLAAKGQVATETQSTSGPARFRSRGNSVFEAAKEVVIHPHGCYHRAAVADAETSNELTSVSTTLDSVPLVRELARAIAVDRFRADSQAAEREVRRHVATTASDRIDTEVNDRLNDVRKIFGQHFFGPLQKLALNPRATDMATSEQEVVARLRLAGHHQLAAHTPRPLPPATSVFQVQVHESAVNNFLEQLGWEGRRANVHELYRQIAELFSLPPRELPEDLPDDVFIRFAGQSPLRVAFQEGRVSFQLALAELSQGTSSWKNFTVRVHYRHDPTQPGTDLVRDQYVELLGQRLHLRDQIALRGVFSRVFSQDKPIQLVSAELRTDSRLDGLEIDQLAIQHGWLSLSLGEVPAQPRTARGPAPQLSAAGASLPPASSTAAHAVLARVRSP